MHNSEVLSIFHETEALLEGHFELRSGLHSNRFFQCAMVLRYPRQAERLCGALTKIVQQTLGDAARFDGVIAPAMGGLFVGHEIAKALDVKSIFAEKHDNKLLLRRGFIIRPGERYLVAEDVITRGGRVQETIDIVKAAGGIVPAVAVLVDRSSGLTKLECPVVSLLKLAPVTYDPTECPLCKQGLPVMHPGS